MNQPGVSLDTRNDERKNRVVVKENDQEENKRCFPPGRDGRNDDFRNGKPVLHLPYYNYVWSDCGH